MPHHEPLAEKLTLNADHAHATPWAEMRRRLEQAETFWLATNKPDGRPHVRPLMAVWLDGRLFFATSESSRKGKNLDHDTKCTIATNSLAPAALDLVVEGTAAKVSDAAMLRRVAEGYASKYGWQVDVRDGAFWGDGAPTAGPPPYVVYAVTPARAYAFPGIADSGEQERSEQAALAPTRWRFE